MHAHLLPRPLRPLVASAAAVLLVVGLAACGSDDDDTATTTTTAPGAEGSEESVVVAEDFSLTDLTVGPGEEFTLDNQGEAPHTLTADDGDFDSGEVAPGSQSDPLTSPDEPGSYDFHCEIHPAMTGTLTVEG